jgi:TnpA family transposase
LFVTIDLEITHDDLFAEIVRHMKSELVAGVFGNHPLPHHFKAWIDKNDATYLIDNNAIIPHRFEFLLYMRLVHHMATNKLTLKHSIKYKKLEDDLYQDSVWKKNKRTILQKIDYPKLNCAIKKTLKTKRQHLSALYQTVNQALLNGENEDIKINPQTQAWRLRSLKLMDDPNDSLFVNFPQRSIVEVMQFVNKKTHFTRAFEPILPKSKKGELVEEHIMAVVLANAIRMGARKMSGVCDLNESTLITAESAYIRQETLKAAIDIVNNAAEKLPIYKKWYINSIPHASLDGLKLGTQKRHGMARHSSKYFGRGTGVSAYNEIMNFFSIAGKLIGSHEYEGSFLFEMVHHQNSSEIKPTTISTDKHGTNALNFGLFDLTEIAFSPRIPKPHRETFWGFGSAKDYEGSIIKPTKFMDEELFIDEWDNIQRLVASLLTGESNPNVAIRKLSSKDYTSNTKKAFVQYNHIVRSEFLLRYLHDAELRRAILCALNRGEAYNNLYRAIAILRKGELRGQSEIEMENWNQCTRLISSIILYYNTYLLNSLYKQAKTEQEKTFLVNLSPSAWIHVNLLGYYLFCGHFSDNTIERYLREWDWQRHVTL